MDEESTQQVLSTAATRLADLLDPLFDGVLPGVAVIALGIAAARLVVAAKRADASRDWNALVPGAISATIEARTRQN